VGVKALLNKSGLTLRPERTGSLTKFVGAHCHAPIKIFLILAATVQGDMIIQEVKPDPASSLTPVPRSLFS
jgi:hypothetical protein